jgi:cytoskeletal protein CcmA (bactofilin family)
MAKNAEITPNENGLAPSKISAELTIVGNIHSIGVIYIDGKVEGDLRSTKLHINEGAVVQGKIEADHVTISGFVSAEIRAKQILLSATARMKGNLFQQRLTIETGASFEGNCFNPAGDKQKSFRPPALRAISRPDGDL